MLIATTVPPTRFRTSMENVAGWVMVEQLPGSTVEKIIDHRTVDG